ncbi:hypothetical protein VVS222_03884 [Vibrio vulnificus]|nr:hypothetical protein VVS222_03884 [Vibrio vulnificus]
MKVLLVNKFFFLKGGAETVFFQERELLQSAGLFCAHNDPHQAPQNTLTKGEQA